jgi:hypothetical protein
VTGTGFVATRSSPRGNSSKHGSAVAQIGTLALRAVLILVVAGVIVAGATALGYTPFGQRIPGAFFPFTLAGGRGPGGPEDAAVSAAPDPGQTSGTTPAQPGRGRGAPGGAGGVNTRGANGAPGDTAGQQQGLFSGRNLPSLQRGWQEEVRYLAIFALMTAIVAVALRFVRPRRRRPQQRVSLSARA